MRSISSTTGFALALVYVLFPPPSFSDSCDMCPQASAAISLGGYRPPPFGGRVGNITFYNDSLYPVTITLWHPDNGKRFASWTVQGKQTIRLFHNGRAINVGDNWGVQLGNSGIRALSQFNSWDGESRSFWVLVRDFYEIE